MKCWWSKWVITTTNNGSIDSTPPRRTVNRVAKPPAIKGSLGSFEELDEEEEDPLEALKAEVVALNGRTAPR